MGGGREVTHKRWVCNGWLAVGSKLRNVYKQTRIYTNTAFILHGAMALIPWLHVMFREKILVYL